MSASSSRSDRVLGPALSEVDDDVLRDAAVLHDVGYAPVIARSGFHPLDGTRHLAAVGVSERVACLVARHSCRVVPLPATVIDALREHRERQDADREIAGDRWTETGLVFTSPLGGHISPRTLAAQWHVIRTAAGLERMRFHDLRHTAVSLLLALGVPPHVVREIVGHSDVKVTMTVYAHGNLDEKAAALSQLSTAVTSGLRSTGEVNEGRADRS